MTLDKDGKLVVPIEGITINNSWRSLKAEVMIDGENYYLDTYHVNSGGYTRTSMRTFKKMPEQVILYTEGNEENALVYDVEAGVFVN